MRSKEEILSHLMNDIADVKSPQTRLELLLAVTLEALIDIRDTLNQYLPAIDRHLVQHSKDL